MEAGIAWEHCRAPTFADTDWRRIAELYDTLERIAPSPLYSLNRAVAEAYLHGPQAGLERLAAVPPESVPARYPGWHAVIGELHFRLGRHSAAERAWRKPCALPQPTPIENSCVAASPSAGPLEASPPRSNAGPRKKTQTNVASEQALALSGLAVVTIRPTRQSPTGWNWPGRVIARSSSATTPPTIC